MDTGDSREPGRRASLRIRSAANRQPQIYMRLLVLYSFALVAINICKVDAKPSATLGCLQKLATGRKDLPPVHICGCVGLSSM